MFVSDGIVHASEMTPGMLVRSVRPVGNLCMLVGFSTGETRLFDASPLLEYPAFEPLEDEAVFADARVDHGIITWLDGELDISTVKVYDLSYEYVTAA